jgi:folate-dependent phosphoribosylglycinamide formyltransferase PurN
MEYKKIVLLAGEWDTTPIVYNFLKENFSVAVAIIEKPVAKKEFLKKRIRRLGWFTVGGQVLFQLLVGKPLSFFSKKRISEIIKHYRLNVSPIPESEVVKVPSINADIALKELQAQQPDLIIVHGTRIISKKILQSVDARFINIHAGITPRYRGSHGAYWALANKDKANCGVTVHLVDAGIDTGQVLSQVSILFTKGDNFSTYPYLQLAEGLKALNQAIDDLQKGQSTHVKSDLNSALWHHPTIWGYLYNWITKGVK